MLKLRDKKIIIFLLSSFFLFGLFQLARAEVVSSTISSSSDDARQYSGTWERGVKLDEKQIDLHSSTDWAGFRWTGINISADATIVKAYFEIYLPDKYDDYFDGKTVYCEKTKNPNTFVTEPSDNISRRTRTTNSVSLGTGEQGTGWKQSSSIVKLVQEVVDSQSGTGDALVVIIDSTSGADLDIRAWDYNGTGEYAAKLYIEYTLPAPTPPIVTNSTGASDITRTSARLNGELIEGYPRPTVHIYWGDNDGGTNPGNWDNDENLGIQGIGSFYADISGLTPGTKYYYRTYAVNSQGSDWAECPSTGAPSPCEFTTSLAFIITATCSDPDGNLVGCGVTSPCIESCLVSGYSGTCSCQFICTEPGSYDACGEAIDTRGLIRQKCLENAIECRQNYPPTAIISCDPSECGTTDCIAYTGCPFHLINNSTDPDGIEDIVKSEWDIYGWGSDPDLSCSGICNFTPQTTILTAGTYTVELYAQDSAGASDTETITFYLRQEAIAGFMCSLDDEDWQICEELTSAQGELVYFKDDPSLAEHSSPSEEAGSIISRTWKVNGNTFDSDNNSNPSTNLTEASNDIELTITDNLGRTASKTHTIGTQLPLPEWREIPPFLWLKNFLASVFEFFNL